MVMVVVVVVVVGGVLCCWWCCGRSHLKPAPSRRQNPQPPPIRYFSFGGRCCVSFFSAGGIGPDLSRGPSRHVRRRRHARRPVREAPPALPSTGREPKGRQNPHRRDDPSGRGCGCREVDRRLRLTVLEVFGGAGYWGAANTATEEKSRVQAASSFDGAGGCQFMSAAGSMLPPAATSAAFFACKFTRLLPCWVGFTMAGEWKSVPAPTTPGGSNLSFVKQRGLYRCCRSRVVFATCASFVEACAGGNTRSRIAATWARS